jgi:hypothetical protein
LSKDQFEAICKALGEMQAEHRMRGELVDCTPTRRLHANFTPTNLPDRIRKMVIEYSRVEDLKRLREENARLNLKVGSVINENRAARTHIEAAVENFQMFAHQTSEVVAKAELFDEKIGIGSKPSGTRIALILTDYSEKLERVLADMREVVNQVTDLRRQPERQDLVESSSKGVPNLSKLSLQESLSGLPTMEDYTGVDVTPESRIAHGPKDARKGRSPGKKDRDEIMTSASKGESGSGGEGFLIPELHQRRGMQAISPDQETVGFVTPKMTK